ncbi:tetratricopeptide repeat protein [Nocardia sp. NPDC050712]|uniref:tetratricopeptide repeat protein n=1 Tax=Nocardia sp. NPDC050712 TaxID=3155518 RepID=UPI00340377D7
MDSLNGDDSPPVLSATEFPWQVQVAQQVISAHTASGGQRDWFSPSKVAEPAPSPGGDWLTAPTYDPMDPAVVPPEWEPGQRPGPTGWQAGAARDPDPGYRGALYELGVGMYNRGEEDEACGLWTQAAEAGHVGAAYDLGVVRFRRGDAGDAERWWRAAADLREPRAMAGLAGLLDRQGNHAEARIWRADAEEELARVDQSV